MQKSKILVTTHGSETMQELKGLLITTDINVLKVYQVTFIELVNAIMTMRHWPALKSDEDVINWCKQWQGTVQEGIFVVDANKAAPSGSLSIYDYLRVNGIVLEGPLGDWEAYKAYVLNRT